MIFMWNKQVSRTVLKQASHTFTDPEFMAQLIEVEVPA